MEQLYSTGWAMNAVVTATFSKRVETVDTGHQRLHFISVISYEVRPDTTK